MGNFAEWLTAEIDRREWTQADLARKSGLSKTIISRVMADERKPGVEFCSAIARALNLRDVDVMRQAGLASPEPPTDTPSLRELISRFSQLSDDDQETILKLTRSLNEMEQADKRRAGKLKPRTG